MIYSNFLPFRIVECNGFRNLISFLEPRYAIQHRTTCSRDIILDLYQRIHGKRQTGFQLLSITMPFGLDKHTGDSNMWCGMNQWNCGICLPKSMLWLQLILSTVVLTKKHFLARSTFQMHVIKYN
ncbi:hypothetical protein PR048_022304 [Dryococelus australis]|uniref:Uncharacterized protein n=1 Tax=Dryococelus australis TaxID=614101 RepID=A0ABQ9H0L5_9NEOP|nr:hypothetical protein PR048_022304 [Dryococelus australis]